MKPICDIQGCGLEAKHMLTEGCAFGEYCPAHIGRASRDRLARIAERHQKQARRYLHQDRALR